MKEDQSLLKEPADYVLGHNFAPEEYRVLLLPERTKPRIRPPGKI